MNRFDFLIKKFPLSKTFFKAASVQVNNKVMPKVTSHQDLDRVGKQRPPIWGSFGLINPNSLFYLSEQKKFFSTKPDQPVSLSTLSALSENVIGRFSFSSPEIELPLNGSAQKIRVALTDDSLKSKIDNGIAIATIPKITVNHTKPLMDVQLLIVPNGMPPETMSTTVQAKKDQWIQRWNQMLEDNNRHGRVTDIHFKFLNSGKVVLEITMETQDSMGAAMVNRLGSEVSQFIESELSCKVQTYILSNDVPLRVAEASITLSARQCSQWGLVGEQLQRDVSDIVMRGILGAAITLSNDTRAINEAIFIQKQGQPLLSILPNEEGGYTFTVSVPLPLGSFGRPRNHPDTKTQLERLGDPSSMMLASYVASVGLLTGLGELASTQNASVDLSDSDRSRQESRAYVAKTPLKEFQKLGLEERIERVGWVQPESSLAYPFDLPLYVVPNVKLEIKKNDQVHTIFEHLYGVTEEKTVSVAQAVAASVAVKNGGLVANVVENETSITVEMSMPLAEKTLGFKDKNDRLWSGLEVMEGIKRIIDWELEDPRRAVTGGKGEENGGCAVATALGADWVQLMREFSNQRLITGTYRPCVTYTTTPDGILLSGRYTFSKEALSSDLDNPVARAVLEKLGNPSDTNKAVFIAAGYMLSRFPALRMLGTFGVDVGHRQAVTNASATA